MPLFKIHGDKAQKLENTKLSLEKSLQTLIEKNLKEVLDIYFLATEYSTSFGGRIDTLGIDESGSPVIIEYKRGTNDNVINQALSYLKWLLDHRAEFENLVRDSKSLPENFDVDWDSPRVICIAESYNKFDLDTVDILPISIELLKYRLYQNDLLFIDSEGYQKVNISTSGIFKKSEKKEKVLRLQKEYSIEDLFKENWKESRDLFSQMREKIFALDKNIIEKYTKLYVAYKLENNFCEIVPQAKGLRVHLDIPIEKVKKNSLLLEDVTEKGHWATGHTKFYIENEGELQRGMELIGQAYTYNL